MAGSLHVRTDKWRDNQVFPKALPGHMIG